MSGCEIQKIKARQVLDSRGNPTVEAEASCNCCTARAMVPSGASTGSNEAIELRDNENAYFGKSVRKAVMNVNEKIAPKLQGMQVDRQRELDNAMIELDGTENKSVLGANAIVAVSMACARLAAMCNKKPLYLYLNELAGHRKLTLPVPQFNVINGGAHAGNNLDIQEHHVIPVGAKSFSEALQMGAECYHTLKGILKKKYGPDAINVGDEGGFAPSMAKLEEAFEMMVKAIKEAGYEKEVKIGIDSASSEFHKGNKYIIEGHKLSTDQLIEMYSLLVDNYPVISIEDGCSENDWQGWTKLNEKLGSKIDIIGDDILVTNPKLIKEAIEKKACNSLLLKVNQIGSVSEAIDAAKLAFENNWKVFVSHRSGETEDSFIADLVVGLGAEFSKFGAPARSDRNAKYNQLLRIEEELGSDAVFAGNSQGNY